MFVKKEDMPRTIRSALRGGHGDVQVTQLLDPEATAGRLSLCNMMELAPGDSVGTHPHTENAEIYYALEGEFVFTENGVEHIMSAGDISITHSGDTHSIENRSGSPARLLAIVIN